ncbi:AGAP013482-PA-like protein [Anopheles sinensis]|uniref:AGAP013482-PA-like protein n=1 Tax=Anopheles sinensis TaxID=74873 RepID=A0A084VBN1_ANOSI|nr:AGAP013482-PA-like protein [Anopheles sinensis]
MPEEAAGSSLREKDRERCDLLKHLNELCHGIDQEIHSHRQEHERVRATLQELYERGREGSPGPAVAHPFSEPDYKRVSDEVIRNQQNQIQLIKEEKDTFEKLWKSSQRTIRILELEIHEYRRQLKQPKSIHDLRQQYTAAVQLLEQNLSGVRKALGEKIDENRHLQQERAEALERTAALEKGAEGKRRRGRQV